MQVVDRDLLVGADRDDLLREDVERVPRDRGLLDRAFSHRLRDDRALEQVGAELREDPPLRRRSELVPRPADPLEAACHRLRALHLDDEIDRAHVDPELQARRRDQAGDPARLEVLLDQHPLLARQRAVVGARDLCLGDLVDPQREPLGQAAVVDEHDRRAVRPDELEERRVDRRPDRARGRLVARVHLDAVLHDGLRERPRRGPELAHVLDRDDDLQIELLALPRVDEHDLAVGAGHPATDLRQRALRGRETDPLERLLDDALEPLERKGEVRAALCPGDRVDLVEDHRLDRLQQVAAAGREEQEERLRGGDEDVGRRAQHPLAVALWRVARPHAHRQRRADPRERPAEVPLDVVVERLERRDVEEPHALAGRLVQPVEPEEERGERLARAGGRLDEDVAARRDRGPGQLLRRCRLPERALEPGPRAG